MRRHFLSSRLRPDAILLNVTLQADALNSVRVGALVVQMRTILRIGFEENNLRPDLACSAQGFGEGIGRLNGNVDRTVVVVGFGGRGYTGSPTFREGDRGHGGRRLEIRCSTATISGRSAKRRRRKAMANSTRPGTTGK
jgi:hypothetical protein